ncbi:hypothetical protein GCM10010360_35410 [Streptomyces nogalater]
MASITHPFARKTGHRRSVPTPSTSLAEGVTEGVERAPAAPVRATVVRDRADGTRDRAAAGSGEQRAGAARVPQAPAWPDAAQVWSWSASVALSGYGPAARDFL